MHCDNQQHHLTMRLFGVFLKCPFGEPTDNCPFNDIRRMRSLELKFQLAEQMAVNPGCQENFRNTHEACYRKRLQGLNELQTLFTAPSVLMSAASPASNHP